MAAATFALLFAATIIAVSNAVAIPPAEAKNLPTPFEFVGSVEGKIFLLAQQLGYVDYYTAIRTCHEAGYSLALITSQAQEDVVAKYFISNQHNGFAWIDGTDFVTRGEWYSPRTGEKLEFFNWVSGRPVQAPENDNRLCLMWKRDTFDAGWWDIPCKDGSSYTNLAFCEVPAAQYMLTHANI